MNAGCSVTVVIKALNEQARIAAALESALAAVTLLGGEVVLADSASTDATVRIAARYPVRVVTLAHAEERCCGIGPQLGWQHARGEYVYVMDGDMQLQPGFLDQALAFLAQHPEVAGVGGRVLELNDESLEYRERAERSRTREAHRHPGPVDRLDGGGLYRRRAVEEAGWLSDRNLHSYEEFDLAARLRARGWKLWRLPADAVSHEGHHSPPYTLLARRWRSRYACGGGELLRAALGRPHLRLVLRGVRELRLYAAVLLWWLLLASVPLWPLPPLQCAAAGAALALGPLVGMAVRKRSWSRASHAIASWSVHAAGLVRGLCAPRRDPGGPIASRVLQEAQPVATPQGRELQP